MKGSAVRLIFIVLAGVVALWLLGALVQGLLISLSLTASRFFLFYWWFQKFGLGVIVGFVLGLGVAWLLLRGADDAEENGRQRSADHLDAAERELDALRKELSRPAD
jgi:hypothetical protein